MIVDIFLWFPRRNNQSTIFGHVSKVVALVAFYFNTQGFKSLVAFSLCFVRPSWITISCVAFIVSFVLGIGSTIHNFVPKIFT
jgi:hypothetical protein